MKKGTLVANKTLALVSLVAAAGMAWADPPFQGTPDPQTPQLGSNLLWPWQVPGKEYVNQPHNINYGHVLTPGQNLAWDGIGGIQNSTLLPSFGIDVDALANHGDLFYRAVIANQSSLLVSVTGDQPPPPFQPDMNRAHIWAETPGGARPVWATTRDINHNLSDAQSLIDRTFDLGGLEVWGPDGFDDTDRFSLVGDPLGVAVYSLGAGNQAVPWITTDQLRNALQLSSGLSLDLDALMVNDNGNSVWDAGDSLMFSVMPTGPYDGGEVWVWDFGANPYFLNHGGHLWDTAFNVRGAFGVDNENIDALEAVSVPEPGSVAMALCTVLLGGGFAFIQKRKNLRR